MHSTQSSLVRGYIDVQNTTLVRGWCFHETDSRNDIKVLDETTQSYVPCELIERQDVSDFYIKRRQLFHIPLKCGWQFERDCKKNYKVLINGETAFLISAIPEQVAKSFNPSINKSRNSPTLIVVDNFYEDPDSVRQFALNTRMVSHPKFHKGCRSEECYRFPGLKERFEEIIGREIDNFERYGTNGCFQYCIDGDAIVYHCDNQEYAGVLFLTPDAPVKSGTRLLRSIHTKKMRPTTEEETRITFAGGFLDESNFETVDTVGNVYNRLVLFASENIHAATAYFGDSKENGRLFQLFFFDLK